MRQSYDRASLNHHTDLWGSRLECSFVHRMNSTRSHASISTVAEAAGVTGFDIRQRRSSVNHRNDIRSSRLSDIVGAVTTSHMRSVIGRLHTKTEHSSQQNTLDAFDRPIFVTRIPDSAFDVTEGTNGDCSTFFEPLANPSTEREIRNLGGLGTLC